MENSQKIKFAMSIFSKRIFQRQDVGLYEIHDHVGTCSRDGGKLLSPDVIIEDVRPSPVC